MHGASGVASGRVRLGAIAQVDTGRKRTWYDEEQQQRDGPSGAKVGHARLALNSAKDWGA